VTLGVLDVLAHVEHTELATLVACIAHITGAWACDVRLDHHKQRAWLAERGLELAPVPDAATFSWPGRGSPAAWRDASGPHGVVTFGVPSGAIWDPADPRQAPAAGFSPKRPLSSRRRAAPRAP
jgi:hypothetical protein